MAAHPERGGADRIAKVDGLNRAKIISEWAGNGTSVAYHPVFGDVFPLVSWSDITGQDAIPSVNSYVLEAVCDDATLELIESDPRFSLLSFEVMDEA